MKKAKRAFDASRTNLWWFDPEDIYIVTDENDALYDPRVKLPVDQALVKNILHHGVLEPVVIVKRDGGAVVVDGRQRVRAAREASKASQAQGGPEIRVPAVLRRGDNRGLLGVMVSANEIRRDDSVTDKARKVQRLMDAGYTEEELATVFGVGKQTINNWLSIFDVAPEVRAKIDKGEVPASSARKLAKMDRKEQLKTVKQAQKEKKTVSKAVREKFGEPRPKMRNRKEIENRLGEKNLPADYRAALRWVLRRD